MVGLPDGKKLRIMYNHLDRIPACDRQTDGQTDRQTSCHGIVRTMHTRRAVKMTENEQIQIYKAVKFITIFGLC